MNVATSLVTPAGNAVDPKIDAAAALKRAAQIFRAGDARDLYGALCGSGAAAGVRFHAFAALRFSALGSPEAGDLSGYTKGFTLEQLASLCDAAAGVQ